MENFDEQLAWSRVREGDKESFLLLYNNFFHFLVSIGIRISNDPAVSKDACQEFFIRLWEKRQSLSDVRNIKGYLYRGYKNQLIKMLLQNGQNTSSSFDMELEFTQHWTVSPEADLIHNEEGQRKLTLLINAFKALPPRQRELLYLRYYSGLTTEAIVEQTGLSIRSVYNQIHIGLNKLKANLSKGGSKNFRNYLLIISCLCIIFKYI
ncbi:RNA polymerase sigma factor [Flavitalea flava]